MATLTREAEETAGYALNRLIDAALEVRSAVDGGDDVDDMREALDDVTGGLADLFEALGLPDPADFVDSVSKALSDRDLGGVSDADTLSRVAAALADLENGTDA